MTSNRFVRSYKTWATKTDTENKQTDKLHTEKRGKKNNARTTQIYPHSIHYLIDVSRRLHSIRVVAPTAAVSLFSFSYSSLFLFCVQTSRLLASSFFFFFFFSPVNIFLYAQRAIFLSFSLTAVNIDKVKRISYRRRENSAEAGRDWQTMKEPTTDSRGLILPYYF